MCEPTTLTVAAIGIAAASAASSVYAQQQQAKASEKSAEAAQKNANRSFLLSSQASNERLAQEQAKTTAELTDVQRQRQRAEATAKVAAGEAGVSGLSVDALLGDFRREEAVYRDRTLQNLDFQRQQQELEKQGFDATRQSRINQANSQVSARPSFAGAALRIGGAGLQAYNASRTPTAEE